MIRNIKFNLPLCATFTTLAVLANLIACAPEMTIEKNEELPYKVDDWTEATDTIIIKPDSVRDMTHADSIRFGLLPLEE